MPKYESVVIVKPNLNDDEIGRVTEKLKQLVERSGGAVTKTESWGKKKLGYEIGNDKKGSYILVEFTGPGPVVANLERDARIEEGILKIMTVVQRESADKAPAPASPAT